MPNYKGTPAIKQVNRRKSEGKSSKFFGVYWHKGKKRWRAVMRQHGKQKMLGHFNEEYDAATVYILSASLYYGQPVRVNEVIKQKDILATG
jgi:hypothetical protein